MPGPDPLHPPSRAWTWGVPARRRRRAYAGLLVAALGLALLSTAPAAASAAPTASASPAGASPAGASPAPAGAGALPAAEQEMSGRALGVRRLGRTMRLQSPSGWSLAPAEGFLFAAFVGATGTQDNAGAVSAFETRLGRKLDAHRVFARWDDPLSGGVVAADITRGRIPILSIRPQRKDGTLLPWAAIADGSQDAAISSHAEAIGALVAPVILTLHHEPDQTAQGTAAEFVAAWRHYVAVFRHRGVTNVAWNWIITPSSYRTPPIGPGADALYPGDDVVDWMSLDPYNWFACTRGMPPAWRSLREMLVPFATWAEPHGKPLMLGEWASTEDPARPGRKGEWFTEAAATLAEFPQVKAISYYEGIGKCPWWNASSPTAKDAFLELATGTRAHGEAAALLLPSTMLGPQPLAVSFDGSGSTGRGHRTGAGVTHWHLDFGDGSVPAGGAGTPPASIPHTYAAGSHLARLTVSDAAGGSSTDARRVQVAAKPIVTASEDGVTATTASLHTWVNPAGLSAQVTVEWRQGPVYTGTKSFSLPAGGTVRLDVAATGLAPATPTTWRVRATSAAGTTVLAERTFSTVGPPDAATQAPSLVTGTSATLHAVVSAHSLPTQYWFEWGDTMPYGRLTPRVPVPAGLSPWVSQAITGLAPGTVYRYRVVAQNESGTAYGAERSFTSRS